MQTTFPQLLFQHAAQRPGEPAMREKEYGIWQALSWGGSALLGHAPEQLSPGSRRWLLFDPNHAWTWQPEECLSHAANQPLAGQAIRGAVRASGLLPAAQWRLGRPGIPSD
mgnify:FL=1